MLKRFGFAKPLGYDSLVIEECLRLLLQHVSIPHTSLFTRVIPHTKKHVLTCVPCVRGAGNLYTLVCHRFRSTASAVHSCGSGKS